MKYELPLLPYSYDALEPQLDAKTLEIHHSKHHQNYINKLNEALEKHPEISDIAVEDLISDLDKIPQDIRKAVVNNGGGYLSHSLFWTTMKPGGGAEPEGDLLEAIKKDFGDFLTFKEKFTQEAVSLFGSGWVWLAVDADKKLVIKSLPNQDNPLSIGLRPILNLDLWEHAYYLKFQNRRPEYIEAWWQVINWPTVNENFKRSI